MFVENTIMKNDIQLRSVKSYFVGFAISGLMLFTALFYFQQNRNNPDAPQNLADFQDAAPSKTELKDFDPNSLDASDWQELGFTERQTATILKYKSVVGGSFNSKNQLKKCYAISEEKFAQLEPYILLPDHAPGKTVNRNQHFTGYRNYTSNYSPKNQSLRITGKFNPDDFSAQDFMNLGFTEKQANSILKYKNYLGGSFLSKEKFKACFVISTENYLKMEPYLLLPEKSVAHSQQKISTNNSVSKLQDIKLIEPFDPNSLDLEGWRNLGFSEKQAHVILNYKNKNLKGSFKSLEEISKCFVISEEKFKELKPYMILTSENAKVSTRNEAENLPVNASEKSEVKTDFTKTDLNEITFKQLIEYGFDEKSAGSFIGFRNKLGGFINKQQILDTYNIDKVLAQRLVYAAPLNVSNIMKYTLMDAPESWLKNHPYFKYYADKIIYYRISYTDQKKIFKLMKIKPEAEEKMKLYLK